MAVISGNALNENRPLPTFSFVEFFFLGKVLYVEVELCPSEHTEGCIVDFILLSERVG